MLRANFITSSLQAIKFFLKKKECKVLSFKVPSEIMFSYLDVDLVNRVHTRIEDGINNTSEENVRKLIKLGWLIDNIRTNGVKNPFQLLYTGNQKYFCHPGTDRILVTAYIDPQPYVEGFYIWYKDLDPHPFILDYSTEIKNPFTLLFKFKMWDKLHLTESRMNKNISVTDNTLGSHPHFTTALNCFNNIGKPFDFPFLTFIDNVQWKHIDNKLSLDSVLVQQDANNLTLSGIKFTKLRGQWVATR